MAFILFNLKEWAKGLPHPRWCDVSDAPTKAVDRENQKSVYNELSCANQTNLHKLFLKQKQAIRTISNANYTAPLFKQLNVLPLESLQLYYSIKLNLCILFTSKDAYFFY